MTAVVAAATAAVETRDLYVALRDPAPLIRDAAFRALAQIAAASGQRMAAPVG
jgi:hypothetical protein